MAERLAVHLYDAFLRPVILQRLAAAFDHKTGCGGGGGEGEEASVMSAEQEPEVRGTCGARGGDDVVAWTCTVEWSPALTKGNPKKWANQLVGRVQ